MGPILLLLPLLAGASVKDAVARLEAGDVQEASRLVQEALTAQPKDPEAHYWAAKIAFSKADYDGCQSHAEEAIRLDPKVSKYHVILGDAYGLKAGKAGLLDKMPLVRKTGKEYEQAVALDQSNSDAHLGLMRFLLRAPGFLGGDPVKAAAEAEAIAALDPVLGTFARAEVLASEGKNDEAVALRHELVAKHADDPKIILEVAEVEHKNKHDDEAEKLYGKVLALAPDDPLASYRLAVLAINRKANLDQARKQLELYLGAAPAPNRPPPAAAHWRLGQVFDLQGDKPRAVAEWQEAVKLDPNQESARKALQEAGK